MRLKYTYISLALLAAATLSGCTEDSIYTDGEGEAEVSLTLDINDTVDTQPVSRTTESDTENLIQKLNIVVSTPKGNAIRYWNSASGFPWRNGPGSSMDFKLNSGTYTIEGWTGDSIAASWTRRYFKGKQTMTLQPDTRTNVRLTCKIANTAVDVVYSDQIDNMLEHYSLVVTTASTSLNFEGRETRTGYFMLPTGNHDMKWVFHGIDKNKKAYYHEGVIKDAKASTKYRFRINYEDPDTEMGAGAFDISIDEESLDIRHDIHFRTSPEIKGYSDEAHEEFELGENAPFSRATNNVGNLQISVRSSGTLNTVTMNMNELSALTGTSTNTIDFMTSGDKNIDILKSKGIIGNFTSNKEKEISTCLITLSDSFTNTLKEGEYKITISATDVDFGTEDVNPKTTATMLRLIVSDDGAILLPATDPDIEAQTPTSLVFRGKVSKNDVDEVGFYYRAEGETGWKYIEGNVASRSILINKEFEATVTNLKQGCTYEYKAAFNRKEGLASMQQTTLNPQLPNAGFEDWDTSSKAYLICEKGQDRYWDSGNHGSSTLSKNVTTPEEFIKHSGKYAAKLQSQFVGLGFAGKFAAGNIFIGQYLKTDGMDGVLGWGRPFEGLKYRPKQLRGYVKYNPATVSKYTNSNAPDIVNDQPDKGIIYIALLNEDCNVQGNGTYPVEVRTKDAHLFNKDASNVIAYGELVLDKATEGNGMIEFTINLDYRSDAVPTYIMITASASKGGDYFAGADGSIMYLDDLQLVY